MTGLPVTTPQSVNLEALGPLIWTSAGVLFTLLAIFFAKGKGRVFLPLASLAFLGMALFSGIKIWSRGLSSFDGTYTADNLSLFSGILFILFAILTIAAITARYWPFSEAPGSEGLFGSGETFPLMLTVVAGAIAMVSSTNLILTFIALETLSIPLYVLAGINLDSDRSKEASLKYFLMGAFASGFFAYGISQFYGATGALDYVSISKVSAAYGGNFLLISGLALVSAGFAFKIALVPFHAWVPDVYQGSPALITGFMASLVKAAGIVAFMRFIYEAAGGMYDVWWASAAVLAVLTMTWGNLLALNQTVIKRLLAYSSIAHAGYLVLAMLALEKAPGMALARADP